MNTILHAWSLKQILSDLPRNFTAQVEAPVFLMQCGLIAVTGACAFWIGWLIRPFLTKSALRVPRSWAPTVIRVCQSVAPPVIWLVMLWLGAGVSNLLGTPMPIVNAGMLLLVAWIFIRLLSFTVKSPIASVAISVVAWSIAALSILGLLDLLVHQLDTCMIYFGNKRCLTALTVIEALLLLAVLLWLTTLLSRFLKRLIVNSESLTPSLQVLLIQSLQILLPIMAVVIALSAVGINLTAFTVAFGTVGLGIGLGMQRLTANLVAGLSLLMGKTIKPGDIIEYKNSYGWVTAMGARYVTLRTRDGLEHLVPNDYFLESGVENWSHSDLRLRLHVPVSIAYESDVREAIALCIDAAKSVTRVLDRPEPLCLLKGFGDSSIDLEIRMWIEDPRNGTMNVKSEALLAVWDRFKKAGIRFPFPQRDVHIISAPPSSGAGTSPS